MMSTIWAALIFAFGVLSLIVVIWWVLDYLANSGIDYDQGSRPPEGGEQNLSDF